MLLVSIENARESDFGGGQLPSEQFCTDAHHQ